MKKVSIITAIVMALSLMTASAAMAAPENATCYGLLGQVHGFHIVSDYVVGVPSDFVYEAVNGGAANPNDEIAWPPTEVNAAGGAVTPGGPGPGFHFTFGGGVPPGASFCTGANSGVIYSNPGQGRPQSG